MGVKLYKIDPKSGQGDYQFFCPGCRCNHAVWVTANNDNHAVWSFNDNMEKPTFSPSILVRWTRTIGEVVDFVCHSFVTDGMIKFLGDCTHPLKDQTVELPDIPD